MTGGDGRGDESTGADADEGYRTVTERGEGAVAVDGSEFVGLVAPADSTEAAERVVEERRAAYPDATHTVPAYRVREEPLREYASDDGEPGGSAGKPALSVLQGEDLANVVAVVTRYYGGTDLGVGGLARAYARAVSAAVDAATVATERPHERLEITVEYDDSGTIRGILKSSDLAFEGDYAERVTFDVRVPVVDAAALRDRIASATSGRAVVSGGDADG